MINFIQWRIHNFPDEVDNLLNFPEDCLKMKKIESEASENFVSRSATV